MVRASGAVWLSRAESLARHRQRPADSGGDPRSHLGPSDSFIREVPSCLQPEWSGGGNFCGVLEHLVVSQLSEFVLPGAKFLSGDRVNFEPFWKFQSLWFCTGVVCVALCVV